MTNPGFLPDLRLRGAQPLRRPGFRGMVVVLVLLAAMQLTLQAVLAAPYAALVMDARNGQVLHAENADTRLHPASLTKMMTLYIAFEAIKRGEITLDTRVKVSAKAAAEQPSKLGLKAGSTIQLRYLIRAAAILSANDAATAIGEAISGSETAFAARMTRTARAMGMKNTTFKNAHGLTAQGHLSTARDMSILGRHLIYDYPQYYNLFSRQSADAGVRTVTSHNRLLRSYQGADGIKTGYTRAAGFNLTASAQRGKVRVIATVFGGTSTPARDAKVAELLDLGFRKAKGGVKSIAPQLPDYVPAAPALVASAPAPGGPRAPVRSLRPRPRPAGPAEVLVASAPPPAAPSDAVLAAIQGGVDAALAEVGTPVEAVPVEGVELALAEVAAAGAPEPSAEVLAALRPQPRPSGLSGAVGGEGVAEEVLAALDAGALQDLPADGLTSEGQPSEGEVLAALEPRPEGEGLAGGETGEEAGALVAALEAAQVPLVVPPARPEGAAQPAEAAPADPQAGAVELADAATPDAEAGGEIGGEIGGEVEMALAAEADGPPAMGIPQALEQPAATPRPAEAVAAILSVEGQADGEADPLVPPVRLAALTPEVPVEITPEIFPDAMPEPEVVSRLSTSGGRHWGVNIGLYGSQYEAERVLLTTALKEVSTLGSSLRKVARTKRGFEANFMGMTQDMATLACGRLQARNIGCSTFGPG